MSSHPSSNISCSVLPWPCRPSLLVLFVSLSACGLLLIIYQFGPAPWQHVDRIHRLLPQEDHVMQTLVDHSSNPYNPGGGHKAQVLAAPQTEGQYRPALDVKALLANFARLKKATRPISGRFSNQLDQMMTEHVPEVDTSQWQLHSPAGKKFTVDQVTAMSVASMQPGGFLVPNVAHIVLPFGDNTLYFYQMVSILSCIHVMRPHRLLLWYAPGRLPKGKWWDRVRNNLTDSEWEEKVIMVQREIPTSVYNQPVHVKEHQSDLMRMDAVLTFGGFYMDIDVFVLKPLEPLRRFGCTIGREVSHGLCNGAFMSSPKGTFLAMWYTAYQVFSDTAWHEHSVLLPHNMQKMFPELCHVEEESMDRPNWTPEEVKWIYGIGQQSRWDWRSKNYVMHLWSDIDKYGKQDDMEGIKTLDSIYGQMCRFILFGN